VDAASPKGKTIQTSNVPKSPARKLGILNGYTASEGEFPYTVYLEITKDDGNTGKCTGALFAPNFVLTAGNISG
jgi:hypothetical protein